MVNGSNTWAEVLGVNLVTGMTASTYGCQPRAGLVSWHGL